MNDKHSFQYGWREATLADLVFFQRGFDLTKDIQKEGCVPVISSSGIQSYHSEAKVQGPGVVIGRKGSLGTVYFLKSAFWPHDTTLWSKDLKGNNPKFVYYYLLNINLKKYDVGSSNPTLNRNHIHKIPIYIPSLDIQNKIAQLLEKYDFLIENNRRRIQLLEESARMLYKEWFVRLRFPGHEHVKVVNGVPEGWERKCAYDILDILSGGTPKTAVPEYWNGEIPFFTPKDSTDYSYVYETEKNLTEKGIRSCTSQLYAKNTIFITARGTVGKINLAQAKMAMNQSCYALKLREPLNQFFGYFALLEEVKQLKSKAVGSVFDAIIKNTFKHIFLLVPPLYLVDSFTEYASNILMQVDAISTQNRKLALARDLLLPKLMNGEVAV